MVNYSCIRPLACSKQHSSPWHVDYTASKLLVERWRTFSLCVFLTAGSCVYFIRTTSVGIHAERWIQGCNSGCCRAVKVRQLPCALTRMGYRRRRCVHFRPREISKPLAIPPSRQILRLETQAHSRSAPLTIHICAVAQLLEVLGSPHLGTPVCGLRSKDIRRIESCLIDLRYGRIRTS